MKSKILDLEINENIFKIICTICIIACLLFCVALYLEIGAVRNYKVSDETTLDDGKLVVTSVDRINVTRKYIEIVGRAYKKDQNIGYFNNRFVIQNMETKQYKALHTEMTYIDEFYSIDDQYDCRRAGMYAKPIALSLKKGDYKVFIEYKNDGENILVDTGVTFRYE